MSKVVQEAEPNFRLYSSVVWQNGGRHNDLGMEHEAKGRAAVWLRERQTRTWPSVCGPQYLTSFMVNTFSDDSERAASKYRVIRKIAALSFGKCTYSRAMQVARNKHD